MSEAQQQWTAKDVEWSIYYDTTSDDIDDWVENNEVGADDDGWVENIPDGIYEVNQRNWNTNRRISLQTKVLVWNGKIDIQSSKEAVAEFLNKTGDWHYFIEGVMFGKKVTKVFDKNGKHVETQRTLQFVLGS
tara:strand:- start:5223 stop:5621 length:399 start_codon:yes stop_codon:yes gene_type:complete